MRVKMVALGYTSELAEVLLLLPVCWVHVYRHGLGQTTQFHVHGGKRGAGVDSFHCRRLMCKGPNEPSMHVE